MILFVLAQWQVPGPHVMPPFKCNRCGKRKYSYENPFHLKLVHIWALSCDACGSWHWRSAWSDYGKFYALWPVGKTGNGMRYRGSRVGLGSIRNESPRGESPG